MKLLAPSAALPLIVAASAGVLAAALFFQYGMGLQPCILCYYQRVPYAAAIGIAGIFWALIRWQVPLSWHKIFPAVMRLLAAVFLAGAGIAFYHAGVEQHWWPGPDVCAAFGQSTDNIEELLKQVTQAPIVHCDKIQWSLFGLSMAAYNVLLSLGLCGYCILAAREGSRHGW